MRSSDAAHRSRTEPAVGLPVHRRMPRIRWMLSLRPRKRAAELRELLLTAEDIGGGIWQVEGGRIWTRGAAGPIEDWAERARAAGLITVWRAFRRPGTNEALFTEIAELASLGDAADAAKEMVRPIPTFRGVITSERFVDLTILDDSTTARQADIEVEGEQLTTMVCCYPVRNYVVAIHHASPALALDEFTRITKLQAARLSNCGHARPPEVVPAKTDGCP